ncbi:hypothetical protein [Streptomyces olivaceoviridis]|uniref:hypothetical protein n=1 Tax=Streptomyces olivaceoviridis TaxID=1921 RepID=UPI0036FC73A2
MFAIGCRDVEVAEQFDRARGHPGEGVLDAVPDVQRVGERRLVRAAVVDPVGDALRCRHRALGLHQQPYLLGLGHLLVEQHSLDQCADGAEATACQQLEPREACGQQGIELPVGVRVPHQQLRRYQDVAEGDLPVLGPRPVGAPALNARRHLRQGHFLAQLVEPRDPSHRRRARSPPWQEGRGACPR